MNFSVRSIFFSSLASWAFFDDDDDEDDDVVDVVVEEEDVTSGRLMSG